MSIQIDEEGGASEPTTEAAVTIAKIASVANCHTKEKEKPSRKQANAYDQQQPTPLGRVGWRVRPVACFRGCLRATH